MKKQRSIPRIEIDAEGLTTGGHTNGALSTSPNNNIVGRHEIIW